MRPLKLHYSILEGKFAVCRLAPSESVPDWALRPGMYSITRTHDELSVVCSEDHIPTGIQCETGWTCLQLQGPFPFEMTGVLAAFLNPLAKAGIGIFALSTFDTDCVLVKADRLHAAEEALKRAGHERIR